jgi:hypothetical protein
MGTGDLPKGLVRARSRFQAWRGQGGGRIPKALWKLAVRLAGTHGVSRTAAALRLDYYALKKQLKTAGKEEKSNSPAFVELPAPPVVVGKQCRFELDNGAGVTRRVHLMGYDAAEIEVLARSFWNAE